MKRFNICNSSIKLMGVIFLLFTFNGQAEVAVQNAEKREVLLDNAKVLMVRLTYEQGSESGFHEHLYAHRTIYVVKGGQLAIINDDEQQTTKVLSIKTGQALFVPASRHNVKNVGNSEIVLVETEIK